MKKCDGVHREYDRIANRDVQIGVLPPHMHVRGKVVWYAYQGRLDGLGRAWQAFMGKAHVAQAGPIHGPPGDVFVCDPDDHAEDDQAKLITILWSPLKE
ncbi:MAG: hypothetical protein ACT4OI_08295 [Methanobacteriota archaeon]